MIDRRQQLMWAIQALAQPAEVQVTLFPDFVCKVDELMLDFDDWRMAVVGNDGDQLSRLQRGALQAIDAQLDRMCAPADSSSHPSDIEELRQPAWETLRALAAEALAAFGWPKDVPPPDRSVYVGGGRLGQEPH